MPIYEYHCKKCDVRVERLQPMTTSIDSTIRCPRCSKQLRRIVSLLGRVDGGLTPKFF